MVDFTYIAIKIIRKTFKSRFKLARLTCKSLIFRKIVKNLFFEGDDIQVIPRNASVEINETINIPEQKTAPVQVIKEIISRSRYIFRMDFCICRVSSDCKGYPSDLGCLFLGRGAARISERVGRLVSVREAVEHIERCQEAGLVHIIGRNRIDSVWLNTGPHDELLSICNCCECCCLWKMAPMLSTDIASSITPMEGVSIVIEPEGCIRCGVCTDTCFTGAIDLSEGLRHNPHICLVCGRCAEKCPRGNIKVLMSSDAISDAIKRVEPLVDVNQ